MNNIPKRIRAEIGEANTWQRRIDHLADEAAAEIERLQAIVAADDALFVILDWGVGSDSPHHTQVTDFRRNRKKAILACRRARKAAKAAKEK